MTDLTRRIRPSKNGPSRFLHQLANLALLVIVVVVSFGIGEILARVVFKNTVLFPRYHSAVQYDKYTLRRMRPDTTFWHTSPDGSWEFRINAQGFRDDHDYAHAKSPGTLRVLVLGDSHTVGFEVAQEATFAAVIERYLQLRGVHAEVLNTGISGFGTAEQLAFLEAEGVRYEPDVIVLGFFANDYDDAVRSNLFGVEGGRLVVEARTYAPATSVLSVLNAVGPLRWLSENSHLYSVAMNTAWMWAKAAAAGAVEGDLQAEHAVPTGGLTDYKRELVVRLLERMYAVARKAGARFVVVDIPVRHRWAGRAGAEYREGAAKVVSSVPEALRPAFRSNSDHFISSEEVLTDFRGVIPLHRPHGHAHITEFTHALLGIAIARQILCEEHPTDPLASDAPEVRDPIPKFPLGECWSNPNRRRLAG
jgi:hypothetical protein